MNRTIMASWIGLMLLARPFLAIAGENEGAVAYLSWDSTSVVTDITPTNAVRRLFVRLEGINSVRGVDLRITWAPIATESDAYKPTGFSVPIAQDCLWLMRGQLLTISQSSDSTLRILSAGSSNSGCSAGNVLVINFPKYSPGQTPPGKIVIARASVIDANTEEDILAIGSSVTMKQGSIEPAPLLYAASPRAGWVGHEIDYVLSGAQFHPNMSIALVRGVDTLAATTASVQSGSYASASFAYQEPDSGWWDLCVTNPGGRWTGKSRAWRVYNQVSGGKGLSGAGPMRSVFIQVAEGAISPSGPRAIAPSQLQIADPQLKSDFETSGAVRATCMWPELRPPPKFARQPDGTLEPLVDFSRIFSLDFADSASAEAGLRLLRSNPLVAGVRMASKSTSITGLQLCTGPEVPPCVSTPEFFPGDPNFLDSIWNLNQVQWYLAHDWEYLGRCNEDIQSTCAWNNPLARGLSSVTLGLLDSGIDAYHPDLGHTYESLPGGGKILSGMNFIGHSDFDFDPDPADLTDDFGHGTNMIGLAAAITDNGGVFLDGNYWGIAGVAGGWQSIHPDSVGVRVLPVRVLDHNNDGTIQSIIQGINYAAANGAKILNMSFGGYGEMTGGDPVTLEPLVRHAIYNAMLQGCTAIAGTGNEDQGPDNPVWPAVLARWGLCIAVGASNTSGNRAVPAQGVYGSNTGDFVDIVAPGVGAVTTQPTAGGYNYPNGEHTYVSSFFGTSLSTALTSGVAATLLSLAPGLRDVDIKHVLRLSAANPGGGSLPNWEVGYGRLDHDAAVRLVDPPRGVMGGTLTQRSGVRDRGEFSYQLRGIEEELGVPDGSYQVHRYTVDFEATFPVPLVEANPAAWVNVIGTKGWLALEEQEWNNYEHLFNYGGGVVEQTTSTGASFSTDVFLIPGLNNKWVPVDTTEARVKFSVLGTPVGFVGAEPRTTSDGGLSVQVQRSPIRVGEVVQFRVDGAGFGEDVTVDVFDARGRRIKSLRGRVEANGACVINWQPAPDGERALGPGVYLIRARQAGHRATGKVVITQ